MTSDEITHGKRVASPFLEMQELTAKHKWLSEMRQNIFTARRTSAIRIGLADGVIARLGATKANAYMYNRTKKTLKLLIMYGAGKKSIIQKKGLRIAHYYADLDDDNCIFEYDANTRRNSFFAKAKVIPDEGYEWLKDILANSSETRSPCVDDHSTDRNPFIAFAYAIDDSASIVFKVRRSSFPPVESSEYKEFKLSCDAILTQIRNRLVESSIRMNQFNLEPVTQREMPKLGVSYLGVPEERLFDTIFTMSKYTTGCHFDVMDGLYVGKYGTFDIDGTGLPESDFSYVTTMMLERILSESKLDLFIDAHLMVYDPVPYIIEYGHSGVNAVTISYRKDLMLLRRQLMLIPQMGMLSGVAIKPKHQLEDVVDILPDIDILLIMTVEPGKGGQTFIREMLPKISAIKKHIIDNKLPVKIQVDGGINEETGPLALKAGADLLVSGSTMVKSADPEATYRNILGDS